MTEAAEDELTESVLMDPADDEDKDEETMLKDFVEEEDKDELSMEDEEMVLQKPGQDEGKVLSENQNEDELKQVLNEPMTKEEVPT